MIQFRWTEVDPGAVGEVVVDGVTCILEMKQHFVPKIVHLPDGNDIIVLTPAREVDNQWKPVTIGGV